MRKNASGKVLVLEKSYGAKLAPFQYTAAPLAPEQTAVQPRLSLPGRIYDESQPWLSRPARDAGPAPEAIHLSRAFYVVPGKGGHEKYCSGRIVWAFEAVIPPNIKQPSFKVLLSGG